MRIGSLVLGIGMVLGVAAAGCGGDKCTGADCAGAVESFTLQYCTSDGQCREGMTCLPTSEDACPPNDDGTAGDCANRGICMPPPDVGEDDPDQNTDPATGEPRPDGGTGTYCFAETWGDPTACQGDLDWAIQALAACNARGATLIDLHVLLSCPGGLPGGAVFTCCTFGDAPVEPPPPDPEPPQPGACIEMPFPADPGIDPRRMARELCGSMNLEVADVLPLDGDDAGNMTTWLAICCGDGVPVDPEPEPETCVEIAVSFEWTSSGEDPKQLAWQQCADMGLELRDLRFPDGEAGNDVGMLLATCCRPGEPVDPGPGPEPQPCAGAFEVGVGNGECDAAIDLKEAAWRQCAEMGAELIDLRVRATCDNGMPGALVATCCPAEGTQPPGPPDPEPCVTMEAQPDSAGEWACRDEAGWKEWAWARCDAMNLLLVELAPYRECENGGFAYARYTCCP